MNNRLTVALLVILATTLILVDTSEALWNKKPINTNWQGLAIKGYDPVAYFVDGRPIEGKKAFEIQWSDAKWWFANAEHRDLFKSDPEKYAPQYGGY